MDNLTQQEKYGSGSGSKSKKSMSSNSMNNNKLNNKQFGQRGMFLHISFFIAGYLKITPAGSLPYYGNWLSTFLWR
jgi:hypothetical protein